MNERIKALIKQCSDYDHHSGKTDFDKERFAELIVHECILLSQQNADMLQLTMPDAAYGILSNNQSLREHFGVK